MADLGGSHQGATHHAHDLVSELKAQGLVLFTELGFIIKFYKTIKFIYPISYTLSVRKRL